MKQSVEITWFKVLVILALVVVMTSSTEVNATTDFEECKSFFENYNLESEPLTREEKIVAMDKEFQESLVKFAECFATDTVAVGEGQSGETVTTKIESTQVAGVQGTETELSEETSDYSQIQPTSDVAASSTSEVPTSIGSSEVQSSTTESVEKLVPPISGKLPEDIPAVANDDHLTGQIRSAALAEEDPDRQAELWNLYRRYKGMPEK